jgi:O-antigen/teichoic acid export membrane protein
MLAALLAIWLWQGGLTPVQLMVAMIASSAIPLLINTVQLEKVSPPDASSVPVDARVRDALPFMLISGLFLLNSRTDLIMLGALAGAHDAGIYAVASRAAEVTSFSMVAANIVLAPRVSRLHHEGNHALLQRMLDGSTRRVLLASAPIAAILIFAAYPLMTRLYGMEYAQGARVLQILAATQLLVVGSGPLGTLLNMTGHEGALARNMFVAVVANALLNFVFVPWLGATGAATATAISMVFSRILLWYQVRRLLGLRPTGL